MLDPPKSIFKRQSFASFVLAISKDMTFAKIYKILPLKNTFGRRLGRNHGLKRKIETSKDVALALGRLGGHMNRKRDGMPGILTLWRGMKKLHLLCEGYILAN